MYEALRAYFLEGHPSQEVARAFGYSPGSFRVLCHQFRRDPDPRFFVSLPRGPRQQPKKSKARDLAVALRKQNHSVYEISAALKERKVVLSPTAVREVLKAEGFAPLPRRLDQERPLGIGPTVEPVADVREFALASGTRFTTRCGGLFLFLPDLVRLQVKDLASSARLPGSNSVYLYEEARSRLRLIGKFFGTVAGRSQRTAERYMNREWANLLYLRDSGFTQHPHYVSRPLARSVAIGCVLVEEFCEGESLSRVLSNATRAGGHAELYRKLTALGYFLATLHNRTARETRVQLDPELRYGARLVEHLATHRLVDGGVAGSLHALIDRWRARGFMYEDGEVLVHGDVTPSNVLYGEHPWVIAIDLERMRLADRVFDVVVRAVDSAFGVTTEIDVATAIECWFVRAARQ